MPCKIKIKENIENLVDKYSQRGLSMSLQDANILASNINTKMKHHVVNFYNDGGKVGRNINIPDQLVDKYFDIEVKRRTSNIVNNNSELEKTLVNGFNFNYEGYRHINYESSGGALEDSANKLNNKFELDLKNLNLTPEVVNYLYQDSRAKSQGRDIENYKTEISKIINNLQSDFTNSEILETLKCI